MGIVKTPGWSPMDRDPDDYRPATSWALAVDPDRRTGLSVIRERIAAGDRIPRHWHDVDEVVLYERGEAVVHLEGEDHRVGPGATVFIPAGAVHGTLNDGEAPVEIVAVYPSVLVRMDLVERNPAPGTEGRPPNAVTYDMSTGEATVHGPTSLPADGR